MVTLKNKAVHMSRSTQLMLSLVLISFSPLAHASNCHPDGSELSIGIAFSDDANVTLSDPGATHEWSVNQQPTFWGSDVPGSVGENQGTDHVYNGPARQDTIMSGPYLSYPDVKLIEAKGVLEFSINWNPDTFVYCSKHKTLPSQERVCVETSTAPLPTSFVVDITEEDNGVLGTPIYSKTIENVNQASHKSIFFPVIRCNGPVKNLEYRVHSMTGGSGEFVIHRLKLNEGWDF